MGSEVSGTAGRVLVVDDDPDLAERIRSVLVDQGYSVDLAGNGREALRILQAAPFDLVISDVMMPVMDGFDLLKGCAGTLPSHPSRSS